MKKRTKAELEARVAELEAKELLLSDMQKKELDDQELCQEIEELRSRLDKHPSHHLVEGVCAELARFTFPEVDRPELYDAWCKYEEEMRE